MGNICCPACGRENLSDMAVICPGCGFAIKEYQNKVKMEENMRTQQV